MVFLPLLLRWKNCYRVCKQPSDCGQRYVTLTIYLTFFNLPCIGRYVPLRSNLSPRASPYRETPLAHYVSCHCCGYCNRYYKVHVNCYYLISFYAFQAISNLNMDNNYSAILHERRNILSPIHTAEICLRVQICTWVDLHTWVKVNLLCVQTRVMYHEQITETSFEMRK